LPIIPPRNQRGVMMGSPRPQPALTLADIFGSDTIYNPRASERNCEWLPPGVVIRDSLTGGALTVAGSMPTICSRAVATPAALALFDAAGLPVCPHLITYGTEAEYAERLAEAGRDGRRLVFQHLHAPGEVPDALYWIPPRLLAYLNNKANLSHLAPAEHVPRRSVVEPAELPRLAELAARRPLVLKGAGPASSGGGRAVVIAHRPEDVWAGQPRLALGEQIVVEQYLEIERNYCLNFAAAGGAIDYLGGSEQVTSAVGAYHGNWLDPAGEPPRVAIDVGREIMRRAARIGYRGIAGFDMVVDRAGDLKVIDLNFRLNGSTPALLWQPALRGHLGGPWVARLLRFDFPGPLAARLSVLQESIRAGDLLPLMLFDPAECPYPAERAYAQVLLLGSSRWEVEAKRNQLSQRLCGPAPADSARAKAA